MLFSSAIFFYLITCVGFSEETDPQKVVDDEVVFLHGL